MASTNSIEAQYQFEELRLIVLAGAKATRAERDPMYPYYHLACPCNFACGCDNRIHAWPLPLQKCYSMELLDRACQERLLKQIGYELVWYCKECGLPSSCGGVA